MIIATCELSTGEWTFEGHSDDVFGIRFTENSANRIYPNSFSFAYSTEVDGIEVDSMEWPPSHIVIRELTPNRVFSYAVAARPDDEVTLKFRVSNAGFVSEAETSFVVPRPPSPFPSWVWNGQDWVSPVPYPEDSRYYEWNEETLSWATVDPSIEQGDLNGGS